MDTIENRIISEQCLQYQIKIQDLESQTLALTIANEELTKEVALIKRENSQLKRMPLFVAFVMDVFSNGDIYLKQMGNNQEYVTTVSDELRNKIKPGQKVAVNNALSIVKILEESFDTRVRIMELDDSPDISFEHIGGLSDEIEEVREAVEYPLTRPQAFERIGVEPPKGILLYGPPGTGKTLIAKAVARNAKAAFIRMSGSELVHKFIGEGAQLVRDLFALARERAPAIVFIDEIDAVGSTRTNDGTSGSAEVQRTLIQLLAEMDGFDNRGDIRIMAATNRVDMLDAALLRPGRFDRIIEIPLPNELARLEIFKIHSRKMNLDEVDVKNFAKLLEGMTGAEIQAVCREAGMLAVRDDAEKITNDYLLKALDKVKHVKPQSEERMYL